MIRKIIFKDIRSIVVFFVLCLIGNVNAQILEVYQPIIVSYRSGVLNNEKINLGIFDYFMLDSSKMKYEYLKYDSDRECLYKFDDKLKIFQTILCLKDENYKSNQEIKLGLFDGFILKRENKNNFIAASPHGDGRYPSHHKIIKSIDILQNTKKTLILRINYQDEFGWKYFGILVLTDFKYENFEEVE